MNRRSVFSVAWAVLVAVAISGTGAKAARAQEGPYVYKSSVRITPFQHVNYWAPGASRSTYTGCWTPQVRFNVQGPLEAGSQITLTFTKPNGATWYSANARTPELTADRWHPIEYNSYSEEKRATTAPGRYGLTVTLSNALTGAKKTLFTGRFDVGKLHYGDGPNNKNSFDYYTGHDWNLPIGQVFLSEPNGTTGRLRVQLWFRGELEYGQMAGYLFHNGKQVASTRARGGAKAELNLMPKHDDGRYRWARWTFFVENAAQKTMPELEVGYPGIFFLDQHPGEYEFKVLYDGKLARTLKFTIGPDGRPQGNGLAEQNAMGAGVLLVPVTIAPGIDGAAKWADYKKEAYYGNGVVGFP